MIERSAIVQLLRRHSINELDCHDEENDLEFTGFDRYGFVTHVKWKKRKQTMEMETKCYDAKWTYERIYKKQLKPGDHTCWHRPYVIWHHAIVTTVEPIIKVIHYSKFKVQEEDISKAGCCDAPYRINYQDCYNADYTLLRARKLLEETRYELLQRNCEHFSRWCKTGLDQSTQVSAFWASLGRIAVTICLRLLTLGLIQYSHEVQEDQFEQQEEQFSDKTQENVLVEERKRLEHLEKVLISAYISMITVVFALHVLVTSCSRLGVVPASKKHHDTENLCSCMEQHCDCTKNTNDDDCCKRCCVCFWCGCFHLPNPAIRSLYFSIQCSPQCTCCRRPCILACGLFWRIILREFLAGAGTLVVVLLEQEITDSGNIARYPPRDRTAILISISTAAHIGGYVLGAFLGRWVEGFCECLDWCCTEEPPQTSESQVRIDTDENLKSEYSSHSNRKFIID